MSYPWQAVFFFFHGHDDLVWYRFGQIGDCNSLGLVAEYVYRSPQVGENLVFPAETRLFVKTYDFSDFGRPRYISTPVGYLRLSTGVLGGI